MKILYSMLLASILIVSSGKGYAFTCNGKVVSTGDTKAEVFMKCGEPSGRDSREEEIIERTDPNLKRKVRITIDEWTYNLGPNNLIRVLTFNNGSLVNINERGYGFSAPGVSPADCSDRYPGMGATKAEVRLQCGEPSWKDEWKEDAWEAIDFNTKRKTTVSIEVWTYNFGPNTFTRNFHFKDNKLVDIKTGGYGY